MMGVNIENIQRYTVAHIKIFYKKLLTKLGGCGKMALPLLEGSFFVQTKRNGSGGRYRRSHRQNQRVGPE